MLDYFEQLERNRSKHHNVGRPRKVSLCRSSFSIKQHLKKGGAVKIINHDLRIAPPEYTILPSEENVSYKVSDKYDFNSLLDREIIRWNNASYQALAKKNYSPFWEAVLNLSRDNSIDENCKISEEFAKRFEDKFGLAVIGVVVHHDEGHINDKGELELNSHAHIVIDRCGRDLKNNKIIRTHKCGELFQDLASEVTGLPRGESVKVSGRKHIPHWQYKSMKQELLRREKKLKEDIKKVLSQSNEKLFDTAFNMIANSSPKFKPFSELIKQGHVKAGMDGAYKLTRELFKNSGIATQNDYSELKNLRKNNNFKGIVDICKNVLTREELKPKIDLPGQPKIRI